MISKRRACADSDFMHGLEEASASQPSRVIAIGAVRQRPRVLLMCAWVRPLVRVPHGAPASVDATTSIRPLPPTGIHKLYERVVAPYLKNAHLEEGDKRWTGLSLARCATPSTRS